MVDAMATEVDRVWKHLAKSWVEVRSPLRPARADIERYEQLVSEVLASVVQPRVLLLGVTPELLLMRWPLDTHIVAVERDQAMIDQVYNKYFMYASEGVHLRALQKDWFSLKPDDLFPGGVDLVIGDGCYTQLSASQYATLGEKIQWLMTANGRFIHRFFLKTENESVEKVLSDLEKPFAIDNFSAFKLRFLMACQDSFEEGVLLESVPRVMNKWLELRPWQQVKPQHMTQSEFGQIGAYVGSKRIYTFPSTRELMNGAIAPLRFTNIIHYGQAYELADRCVFGVMK